MTSELVCFHCQKISKVNGLVGRKDECAYCRSDLHCCRNCEHYDRTAYNECREPSADVVKEKERSNFCDYFKPGMGKPAEDNRARMKAAADALFSKTRKD
jgi:hypothetical protein